MPLCQPLCTASPSVEHPHHLCQGPCKSSGSQGHACGCGTASSEVKPSRYVCKGFVGAGAPCGGQTPHLARLYAGTHTLDCGKASGDRLTSSSWCASLTPLRLSCGLGSLVQPCAARLVQHALCSTPCAALCSTPCAALCSTPCAALCSTPCAALCSLVQPCAALCSTRHALQPSVYPVTLCCSAVMPYNPLFIP